MSANILKSLLLLGLLSLAAMGCTENKGHTHANQHGAELVLDHGQKWPTDESLRRGMEHMRAAMAESLPAIHQGQLDAARYSDLEKQLTGEVGYIIANCRLKPNADAQLHVVLSRLTEGMERMKGQNNAQRAEGALRVVQALNAYGEYFNHPDWQPLAQ